jgi:hypothetical protein
VRRVGRDAGAGPHHTFRRSASHVRPPKVSGRAWRVRLRLSYHRPPRESTQTRQY